MTIPPFPLTHTQRVVDLLRIKQALDAGTSLELVPLHQSLQV